jgi:large subunit ribosomal protein L7/L12
MADEDNKKENQEEEKEEDTENEEEDEDQEEEGEEQEEESEDEDDDEEEEADDDESEEDDEGDEEMDGEDVEVPEKFADIVEEIEEMPVVELNELVSLLEKKWGVSAQAVAAAGAGGGGDEEEEEKDAYDVELTDFGDSKISVIKAVKASLGLGLKEAKGMVEDAPVVLKEGMDAEEAEELKENIEEEGGTVELK